jgi:hypothetical protein
MPRMVRDDYPVLMWNFMDPLYTSGRERAALAIRRFREIACNGGTLIATFVNLDNYRETLPHFGLPPISFKAQEMGTFPFLENDFAFYVMNICRPLYWSWGEAKPIFLKQYQDFDRGRDRTVFVRVPCVNDPVVAETMRRRTGVVMDGLAEARHLSLLYDLRDEPSITSFLLASDSCFCEHCLARMREWLKGRYGDLDALNAEWQTDFASWDEVVPMTTQEAVERREAGRLNFAPWHDHRDFMNATFARICEEQSRQIREADPEATVGLAGTQCPSVFGGYDFARLVPVTDWVEAYDFGNSVDLFRSFKPRRDYPIVKTDFSKGPVEALDVMLWTYVYQSGGYGGTIIWESNSMLDVESEQFEPTENARLRSRVYSELRGGIPRLLQDADEVNSPVAVHYSHASINADYITAVPNRPRAFAAYETERFDAYRSRVAWWKLLEDLGLRPVFVSSEQIEAGRLAEGDFKVLVLPRSVALSDAEAEAMKEFVRAGGTLVADCFIGRMDEHCRERETGALDDLFGITREPHGYDASAQRASYDLAAEPGSRPRWGGGGGRVQLEGVEIGVEPAEEATILGSTEMADTPVGLVTRRGHGRAVLMNAAPYNYLAERRRPDGGRALRDLFGWAVREAGVTPLAHVLLAEGDEARPLTGWKVWSFSRGEARYFGLAPDLDIAQDTLGGITGQGRAGAAAGVRVRIELSAAGHIYEARTGRYLREGSAVEDTLSTVTAPLYAVLPYRVKGLDLAFDGSEATATLQTDGVAKAGEHVFRFDLVSASGERLLDAGANVAAPEGAAVWRPKDGLPSGGTICCRDVATGLRAELQIGGEAR